MERLKVVVHGVDLTYLVRADFDCIAAAIRLIEDARCAPPFSDESERLLLNARNYLLDLHEYGAP